MMKYRRIVDVGMVATEDGNTAFCNQFSGKGWEEVPIKGTEDEDAEDKNQIRGSTSDPKIRICARFSDKPIVDDKPETYGVCKVMLSKNKGCPDPWESVATAGFSNGDVNQNEHGDALWLCITREGCEMREDDAKDPTRALTEIGLIKGNDNICPDTIQGAAQRIQVDGGASGDFNEGMHSGGDVFMCTSNEARFG
jgi:hypothetical protein